MEEDAVLRACVYAVTRRHQDADDILQEVWQVLAAKLDQYDDTRPFRPWALGVARVQVLKWRQARGRDREAPSSEVLDLLATTAIEHGDEIDIRLSYLEACLRRLTDTNSSWVGVKNGLVAVVRTGTGQTTLLRPRQYVAVAPGWPFDFMGIPTTCPFWQGRCQVMTGRGKYP